MAANTTPLFPLTPVAVPVLVSTANTARDGTGTIVTVYDPGTAGGRLDGIAFQAQGTTTAGVIRIFVRASAAGTWFLRAEILVTAITPSTTVQAWSYSWVPDLPLILADANLVGCSTHNAESFSAHPSAGDF
jgi:hypothetical protein